MDKDFREFQTEVMKKRGKKGDFKVKNSWGIYDAYKLIRKHKWYDIGRPLKEHEFYSIVRKVNDCIAELVAMGETVVFPCRMGSLELVKMKTGAWFVDGKLKVSYPVDWNATLRLWYEDEEAMKEKILIRDESKEVFRVRYNKFDAIYENKHFYDFVLNRFIKKKLKENINNGTVDTMWEKLRVEY